MDSPFKPGFGKNPPYLAGRDAVMNRLELGLEQGQWPQERGILVTGLRGVGKTVILNHAEDLARGRGWRVVSETATQGFFERIVGSHLPRILGDLQPQKKFRVTSLSLAGVGSLSIEYADGRVENPTFRTMVHTICELLKPDSGIVFSIDEVSSAAVEEFALFASEYQHLVREDDEVAFIGAGVQGEIRSLLAGRSATFLRRCANVHIGLLDPNQTRTAYVEPIRGHGRSVSEDVLDFLVSASQGYPFLVQLIGDLAWRRTPQAGEISLDDARDAYRRARKSLGPFILEPSLSGLSEVDRQFLLAMAKDDGPSRIEDIRVRMGGVDSGYAGVYRQRLLDAGVIVPAGRGRVTIGLPYLREYLRDHAAEAADDTRGQVDFPPPPPLD